MSRRTEKKDWAKELQIEADRMVSGKRFTDERFWTLKKEKDTGNGYAVIRFLPPHPDDDLPMVKYWTHSFKGANGQWYIEKSRTTLNEKDPCGELNSKLWNTGTKTNQDIARAQKRKLTFVSNILVVEDPANRENEGKVFLYKYGKKIFNKINEAMNPDEYAKKHKGAIPFIPFEYIGGANFILESKKVDGYINYDTSVFQKQTDISIEDQEEINKQLSSLKEFVDPNSFKTYQELKERLVRVLGDKPYGFDLDNSVENTVSERVDPTPVSKVYDGEQITDDDDDFSMEQFEELALKSPN